MSKDTIDGIQITAINAGLKIITYTSYIHVVISKCKVLCCITYVYTQFYNSSLSPTIEYGASIYWYKKYLVLTLQNMSIFLGGDKYIPNVAVTGDME